MKYLIYALFATLLSANVCAQTLKGTVKAQNGESIATATVSILNTERKMATDKQGHFSFPDMIPGTYQLSVTAVGYASKIEDVKIGSGIDTDVDITLNDQYQQLNQVVVTANKREEDILLVPTSITSLSAKKIEDTRTWGLQDVAGLVPNYAYQELGAGSQQIQSIRGIQAFSENPAVSTYIDDVNNLDILANNFAFTDIERIEVLRGPQATLFGRNAMGGVISIVTKEPTNKTSGFAEVDFGNQGLQRYTLGIKTPLVKDKLFFGLTGLYQTKNGYLTNDTTDTGAKDGGIHGKKVGGEQNVYGNLFLKWLPSQRLSFTLNLKGQRDWSDNTMFLIGQASDSAGFANPDKINLGRIGEHERNIFNTSIVGKYYGDSFMLTSISAYQNIRMGYTNIGSPSFYSTFYDKSIGELLPPQEVYSEEFRINSTGESKLQYTAGIYGFHQRGYTPAGNTTYELSDVEAAAYNLPNGAYVISRQRNKNYGLAGFGEISYLLTKQLKATAGLRYDYEHRQSTFNGFGNAAFIDGVVTDFVPDTTVAGNYSAFSPKVALSYFLRKNAHLYVTYTRGFRAGGINAQSFPASSNVKQTYDPEYSDNFEAGYKASFIQGKLNMSVSAFLIQWRDMQLNTLVAPFTYALENIGNAQSMGLEFEVSALPLKGLLLEANMGLDKTKYKDFELIRTDLLTGAETKTSIGGNSLSNTPSHTLYFATQYEMPIAKQIKGVVRGEIRNTGQYYADIQNTMKQPSYTLVNMRAGVSYAQYELFFWGRNITNERYILYGSLDSSFGRNVLMASPATYGVTLSARF